VLPGVALFLLAAGDACPPIVAVATACPISWETAGGPSSSLNAPSLPPDADAAAAAALNCSASVMLIRKMKGVLLSHERERSYLRWIAFLIKFLGTKRTASFFFF
jgi:hypothetical protein